MSDKMKSLEADMMAARKAGDKPLVGVLGMLVSKVRMIAKNDKNRDVLDGDVLTAALKTVKEVNETRDALLTGNRDTTGVDYEISVVSAYIPKKMDEAELRHKVEGHLLCAQSEGVEGKALRGYVMKTLSTHHRGEFDPAVVQAILAESGV